MNDALPFEAITDRDEFGNYETDLFPCPRCGNDRVVFVFQFHGWMCAADECKWTDTYYLSEDAEPRPAPKRRARPWQEIWPEMAAAAPMPVPGESADEQAIRDILNPVNVGWSRGLPLSEH